MRKKNTVLQEVRQSNKSDLDERPPSPPQHAGGVASALRAKQEAQESRHEEKNSNLNISSSVITLIESDFPSRLRF